MTVSQNSTSRLLAVFGFAIAAVACAYWPALHGPFLLDDFVNLNVLGAYGPLDNWDSFLYYLTSGNADPTGRPVALLTFLLDGTSWPTDPLPFKRTNLAIHLLNTCLLAWVITRLQAALQRKRAGLHLSPWAPGVAALLWGAHPFFVSTAMYVVQRQAMLPLTFILSALLAWDRSVLAFAAGHARRGWAWALLGIGGATLLAGLSKANGFLAPLLVGVAHVLALRPSAGGAPSGSAGRGLMGRGRSIPAVDRAALICLGLPTALIVAYLVDVGLQLWPLAQVPGRDWSLTERLLTQPRALWSYLWQLAVPRAKGGGLYVDDFPTSHGWLAPPTTLLAVGALALCVAVAWKGRNRFPVASFAWFFFLGAHLLESTTVPLELYFEHRNYVPAAMLGWPVAHGLLSGANQPKLRALLTVALLSMLALLTHQRAMVWGDAARLTALSAQEQQQSTRSQIFAAQEEMRQGDTDAALARIRVLQQRHPHSVDVAINAISFECDATGSVLPATMDGALAALRRSSTWNYGLYEWMQNAAVHTSMVKCRGFGHTGLRALVAAAEANPHSAPPTRMRDLRHVQGRIALAEGQPDVAQGRFNAAVELKADPEYALVQAAALGDAGAQLRALQHLDYYDRLAAGHSSGKVRDMASLHAWLLRRGYYRDEFTSLRQRLRADADAAQPDRRRDDEATRLPSH